MFACTTTKLWPIFKRALSCPTSSVRPWANWQQGRLAALQFRSVASSTQDQVNVIGSDCVVRSPFSDVQLPTEDIYALVTRNFSKFGSRVGIIDGVSGRQYFYNEIAESTIKFAMGLQHQLGFAKGDVLAIVAPNLPEFGIAYLGTLATGGVVTPCNPAFTADQLARQFRASNAKVAVTVSEIVPTVQQAAAKSGVEKIVVLDAADPLTLTGNLISYSTLIANTGSQFSPVPTNPDEVRVLIYTSGTTLPGVPKGVMLTNRSVCASILQVQHPELLHLREDTTRFLGSAPFFHSAVFALLPSLYAGSRLVTLPKFQPELFLSCIEKYGITTAILFPPLVLFLAKHPLVDRYHIKYLNDILTGAAPIGEEVMKTASQRIRCNVIRHSYGLTETGPITHMMPSSMAMQNTGSIGYCIQSVRAKVVDLESEEALPPNEKGEVWIQGPNVMKGYLNNPDATLQCLTSDGWFKTGDLGHYDEKGLFYISDRLKEVIRVRGVIISPAEIEAVLLSHPKIADVAVIGIADNHLGEIPKAFVVKKEEISEKEVLEFVAGKVSQHKHLVGGVTFIQQIPKSPSGKILRRVLKHNTTTS